MACSDDLSQQQRADKERALADIETAARLIEDAIFDLADKLPSSTIGKLVSVGADLEQVLSEITGKKTLPQ